jgi:hypothetical protein
MNQLSENRFIVSELGDLNYLISLLILKILPF